MRRTVIFAPVAAVLLMLSACGGSSGEPAAQSSPQSSASPGSKASPQASATPSPTPRPSPTDIPPNRKDVAYVVNVDHVSGNPYIEIDRVLFLTGDAANDAAETHGDETPVPNDYYIVNDNDIIRTFPIAPDTVVIKSIQLGCPPPDCTKAEKVGNLGDIESFLEDNPDGRLLVNLHYNAKDQVDRISEIYLP